jgi:CRISPR/Cas system CMR subunit Cmr4 (Cas7 group RAMP superfamily)
MEKEKIEKVLAENKARQEEAKRLNSRAGENLFKVFSGPELIAWITERISGARRMTEITDSEKLRLPVLDQDLVLKILRDNPDEIEVIGRACTVEYRGVGYDSLVRIDFRGEDARNWLNFPTEGIRLPGGREVVLYSLIDGYSYYIEAKSSQFREKARECLNKKLWEEFITSSGKPTVETPQTVTLDTHIPEVREYQYGTCVATDEPLLAFGVVSYTPKSYWNSEKFETKWFKERTEAETERTKTVEIVEAKKSELSEIARKNMGDIREVTIDRRGQHRKPELNGCRIDNRYGDNGLTPDYFWSDLLNLVGEFGRGLSAFAIYRGDSPLLVYLNRERIEKVLPFVQDLIKTLEAEPTFGEKEDFWRKLEEFRTKEIDEARIIREKREAEEYARQETERQKLEAERIERERKEEKANSQIGMNSLGDAFDKLGL